MRKLLVPVARRRLARARRRPRRRRDQRVKVGDNYFVRPSGVPTVTVSKGTKVKWVWTGNSLHNVKVTQAAR